MKKLNQVQELEFGVNLHLHVRIWTIISRTVYDMLIYINHLPTVIVTITTDYRKKNKKYSALKELTLISAMQVSAFTMKNASCSI